MYRKTALYTTFLFAIMLNVNCKNDNKEELTSVTLKNTAKRVDS